MVQVVVNMYNLLMLFTLLQLAIVVIMTINDGIYTYTHIDGHIYIYQPQNKKEIYNKSYNTISTF